MDNDLTIKFAQPGTTIDVPDYGNVDMVRVERTLDWLKKHHAFWDQDMYVSEGDEFYSLLQRVGDGDEILIEIPASFNLQETDDGENECGTTFCFAGAALMLHDRIAIKDYGNGFAGSALPLMADGNFTVEYDKAAWELLGLTQTQAQLIFYLIPSGQHDIDIFIQYVHEVIADKMETVSKNRYYELLYEKYPELVDLD